jgi:hypothetical protein
MTNLLPQGGVSPMAPTEEALSSSEDSISALQQILLQRKRQEWLQWVEKEYTACKNARSVFEKQWHINIAFYKGRQYISPLNVPGAGFRLNVPKAPPWRVRIVINKIRTAVRTETAKLTSSKPIPTVIPATTEDEDFSAARVAELILKSVFNTGNFSKVRRDWVWWGVVTGNSYIKSYYNPYEEDAESTNPPQPDPQNPNQMLPPQPAMGKICIESVTPFHLFVPDLLATNIEEQPYVIHCTTKSPLWVEKNFGFRPTPDTRASLTISEAAFFSAASNNQVLDSVLVKEVWLKPGAHQDFPAGGMLTVIGGRVVQERDSWPLPFPEYPFYKYEGIPTGEFFTDSVVTDLIPVQKEYNRTKSQMIEIKNTVGKPKIIYPKGSIDPRRITSEPGQSIPYTPGFQPPILAPGAEVPQSMHMELDQLRADFDDISGQHEITRGNTPSQVTSGTAISFLAEQDDSKLSYQVSGIEDAVQKLGKHYLKYVATYWDEPRLVRVVGRDNDFEAKHWKGSDLRGNTDVRVMAGSALPYSKAARTAMITEFMINGWIAPQDGLELIEFGGFEKVMEDFLVDKRAAQRENMKMAEAPVDVIKELLDPPMIPNPETGEMEPAMGPDLQYVEQMQIDIKNTEQMATVPQIPYDPETNTPWQPESPMPVNSWDNHQLHIHFHNQFRKTQQFELLDDVIKQMFELHVQAHQYALMMPQMGAAGMVSDPAMEQAPAEESATLGESPGPVPGETEPSPSAPE